MSHQVFVIEFAAASAELLVIAGMSRERITGALGNGSAPYLMLTTTDFSELDHWRIFLNREGCPYRYGEVEANGMREMGRSRSPGWVEHLLLVEAEAPIDSIFSATGAVAPRMQC